MFCLLLLFWLILNGAVTAEIILLGIVICALLTVGVRRMVQITPWSTAQVLRNMPRVMAYAFYLLGQIIWSSLLMIRVILLGGETHPCLTWFQMPVDKKESRLALANSITLTPGTVTVAMGEQTICVYAVQPEFAQGLKSCGFVSRLRNMEGEEDD